MRQLILRAGIAAGVVVGSGQTLQAANETPLSGITVSPPLQQIVVSGAPSTPITIKLTNRNSTVQQLKLATADFKDLDESGGVAFLGSGEPSKYGLAQWLVLETDKVRLEPGETKVVTAQIENRPNLALGGHYGAVLISLIASDGAQAPNKVGLTQVAASLVLAIKSGPGMYNLSLDSLEGISPRAFSVPNTLTLRFHNQGNVHVAPRGTTELRDPAGRVVAKGVINTDSALVLPDSYRKFKVPLESVSPVWLPGRYQLAVTYRIDGEDKTKTYTQSVWLVNLPILGLLLLVLLISVGGGYVTYRFLKRKRVMIRS